MSKDSSRSLPSAPLLCGHQLYARHEVSMKSRLSLPEGIVKCTYPLFRKSGSRETHMFTQSGRPFSDLRGCVPLVSY